MRVLSLNDTYPKLGKYFRFKKRVMVVCNKNTFYSGCRHTLSASDEYRTLTSPNYPHPYPLDLHCDWNIVTNGDYVIKLHFVDFKLEKDFPGCFDFMMIYEDGYPVSRLCANEGKNLTFKASKSLRIVLQTDNSRSFKGFKAIYRKGTFPCIPILEAMFLHWSKVNNSLFKFLVVS